MKKIILIAASAVMVLGMDSIPLEKRQFSESKFVPDISVILDASYVNRDVEDHELGHLELDGIAHGIYGSHSHGEHAHSSYNANNGFNLNYAELVLSSNVDPFFEMNSVFHISEESIEIEELYITSTALDYGLRARVGKFNSNFGYLNEQHHHYWDFNDQPLVYNGFLGMHGINETGIQFQYTAPTDLYLMVGVELLQGDNEQMFGNAEVNLADINASANPEEIEAEDGATLTVAYVKTAFDIGDTAILTGLSYANGTSHIDHTEDEEGAHAFVGDSTLYGFDFVAKHSFDSYSFVKLQTEVLYRDMEGVKYTNNDAGTFVSPSVKKEQAGAYLQAIYAPNRTWATGVRYDTFFKNDVNGNSLADDLVKYSAMVEYKTSEFARFRLQYNYNDALTDEVEGRVDMSSVILSANISIGAHGAHSF